MPFKDLVSSARKSTPTRSVPTSPAQPKNLVEAAEETKPAVAKKDISYKDQANQGFAGPVKQRFYEDSEIKGFVPGQRTFGSRQNNDPKHGSIIRNISSESDMNKQMNDMGVKWDECRHRKSNSGKDFCAEYHSLCYKEKCKKARR